MTTYDQRAAYKAAQTAITDKANPPPKPFDFVMAGTMEPSLITNDFVEGMLQNGDLSVVYGPSNSGKSFFVLEVARCVAMGAKVWGTLEVEKGGVLILALEGTTGITNRIAALRKTGRIDAGVPMAVVTVPFNILEKGNGERLAATVRQLAAQCKFAVKLVIIDTLARAMAGANEDSAQDMGEVVKAADAIKDSTGAHVLFVHHSGKTAAAGARGSSSLRAATGTEIEINRPENCLVGQAICKKQRDLSYFESLAFSLEIVELGLNTRGKPVTSCVVSCIAEAPKPPKVIKAETLRTEIIAAIAAAGKKGLLKSHLRSVGTGSNSEKDAAVASLGREKIITMTPGAGSSQYYTISPPPEPVGAWEPGTTDAPNGKPGRSIV